MTDTMPPAFWQGIEQFNQGKFYDCHDTLEALWMEAAQPEKPFYQGILQVAVSLYHLSNSNWRGAVILLGEGINRLRPYQPSFGQIDVEDLVSQSAELLATLQELGAEAVALRLQAKSANAEQEDQHQALSDRLDLPLPIIQTIAA
jgi:uncharacterized protein